MESLTQTRVDIPNVLTIAGVDPSGGAGVLADIKAMSACGAFACGVVTALTAQNTQAVTGVLPIDLGFVRAQIDTLFADVRIDAVKIGMLGTSELIETVAERLRHYRPRWIVLDPVMVAKSGDRLLAQDAQQTMIDQLLPLASVLTPNLPEALALLGRSGECIAPEAWHESAQALRAMMSSESGWVLLKGGHLDSDMVPDLLVGPQGAELSLSSPRIPTKNTHGTGCTLSSAIAAFLPQTQSVPEAVKRAQHYITGAIEHADRLKVGHGHGPTHHFWQTL